MNEDSPSLRDRPSLPLCGYIDGEMGFPGTGDSDGVDVVEGCLACTDWGSKVVIFIGIRFVKISGLMGRSHIIVDTCSGLSDGVDVHEGSKAPVPAQPEKQRVNHYQVQFEWDRDGGLLLLKRPRVHFPDVSDDFDEENTVTFPPTSDSSSASPTKRLRHVEWGLTRKRRKATTCDDDDASYFNNLESGMGTPSSPALDVEADGHDVEVDEVDALDTLDNAQLERDGPDQPIDWLLFTEAIEDGICGFHQLTQDVFIVQGWDQSFHRPT
ncbi:hypothetical protein BDN72DRAFT_866111, partial [Pluteus cervinus]